MTRPRAPRSLKQFISEGTSGLARNLRTFLRHHGIVCLIYSLMATLLMRPMFEPGSPPGVDSPTFLHLGWVVELALTGALPNFLSDHYWYGGWPYLLAYPPLSYGAIGLLSALSPVPVEISFRALLVLAYIGFGISVYGLCLELGVRKIVAAWGGTLAMLAYPMFVSMGIFGWYSTIFALPFAVGGFAMAEKSLRTGRRGDALCAGFLLAASLLSHHMTGFAFGLAMIPWAFLRIWGKSGNRSGYRVLIDIGATFLLATLPWVIFFVPHLISVGFEREIAGNWDVGVAESIRKSMGRELIGRETYPSYIGMIHIPLAIGGMAYAFATVSRASGSAIMLGMFTWFALGIDAMPFVRYWPLSGLDIARFTVFMVPFMAVMGAFLFDAVLTDVLSFRRRLHLPRFAIFALGIVVAVGLLAVPFQDGLEARSTLIPVQRTAGLDASFDWIKANTPEDSTFLSMGFRNWDDWWIPQVTGRLVMDGWNDEGAPPWRQVREVRHMGWFGEVNTLRLYRIMTERQADFVLIYHWHAFDSPHMFEAALVQDPFLFRPVNAWPGVALYERLDRG